MNTRQVDPVYWTLFLPMKFRESFSVSYSDLSVELTLRIHFIVFYHNLHYHLVYEIITLNIFRKLRPRLRL